MADLIFLDQIRSRNTSFLSSTTQKTQDLLLLKTTHKLFDNRLRLVFKFHKNSDLSLFILALALTQCGKTGSMLSLIYHSINMYNIPINVYSLFLDMVPSFGFNKLKNECLNIFKKIYSIAIPYHNSLENVKIDKMFLSLRMKHMCIS